MVGRWQHGNGGRFSEQSGRGDGTCTLAHRAHRVSPEQIGTNGANGADGDSAYAIWLAAGNTGTEVPDFLNSLVGARAQLAHRAHRVSPEQMEQTGMELTGRNRWRFRLCDMVGRWQHGHGGRFSEQSGRSHGGHRCTGPTGSSRNKWNKRGQRNRWRFRLRDMVGRWQHGHGGRFSEQSGRSHGSHRCTGPTGSPRNKWNKRS